MLALTLSSSACCPSSRVSHWNRQAFLICIFFQVSSIFYRSDFLIIYGFLSLSSRWVRFHSCWLWSEFAPCIHIWSGSPVAQVSCSCITYFHLFVCDSIHLFTFAIFGASFMTLIVDIIPLYTFSKVWYSLMLSQRSVRIKIG